MAGPDTIQLFPTGRLKLEASSACQLRCPSCPTTTGHTEKIVGKSTLKLADFVRLLDGNPWIGHIELSNYGEVFLNPQLPGIFRHAFERNVTLAITNGANLNNVREDALDALVRYRVAAMTCSLDGASQETYARYRVRGRFERVIANIQAINAYKKRYGVETPRLLWQFIAFGHNQHEIEIARAMAASLGMDFYVKLSWDEAVSPLTDGEAVKIASRTGVATRSDYKARTGKDYAQGICDDLWYQPQINWDGKVLGCCRNFWSDFGGNAFVDGLIASLNGEKLNYARAMLAGAKPSRADIPCTTCDIYTTRAKAGDWMEGPMPIGLDEARTAGLKVWNLVFEKVGAKAWDEAAAYARLMLQLEHHLTQWGDRSQRWYKAKSDAFTVLADAAHLAGRAEADAYYRGLASTPASDAP